MAVDFSNESPLAIQLQSVVQPKLAEFGWTTGGDDTTLFEYILLMLANDKNEAQVAAELSNDLLDLGPENTETQQFAQWLFEQIEVLKQQLAGGSAQAPTQDQMNSALDDGSAPTQDTDMEGAGDSSQNNMWVYPFIDMRFPQHSAGTSWSKQRYTPGRRAFKTFDEFSNYSKLSLTMNSPTGPKAMRNGNGAQSNRPARGGRMLNQMNKSMNRNEDSALHRVRGAGGGIGRINSHAGAPKGPRGNNLGRGMEAMANGRGIGNANLNMGAGNMNGMNMGGMPGMPGMAAMGNQNGMPGMLNPQQQMALMQMYEQQAQMMQQIFAGATPGAPGGFGNSNFNQNRNGTKKPLHQRMDRPMRGGMTPSTKFTKKEPQDEAMTDGATADNGDNMEVETSRGEPSSTMCKFNLRCSNPDCAYVHQSPAAPQGTPVDMADTCDFGAACTNKKCVGKHPSPAQRHKFKSEQLCAFYPNCRNPETCPYKHPTERPCRNGADCTTEGCPFFHNPVKCKFTPCLNAACKFKHEPGQKNFQKPQNNVWVAGQSEKQHVSERKFADETLPEELIIPGQNQNQTNESVDVQS